MGLEAAKALKDLGLQTHVVEFAPQLMAVQLDATVVVTCVQKTGDQRGLHNPWCSEKTDTCCLYLRRLFYPGQTGAGC